MLLSLLVLATIAGAKRPMPRLALPEMLLSFLLAQLTVPLVQLMVQLILQQLVRSSEVLRSFLLAQPAPPGLLQYRAFPPNNSSWLAARRDCATP